jgi:hypothetical protein
VTRFAVGDLVCVHDGQSDEWGDFPAAWIGEIAGNETPGTDLYLVRHRPGRSQLSKCECMPSELRRVITTFEGPMCVECPPPSARRRQ